jgi:hypothetical protein
MITQTIGQLQELGFHCNNFIKMTLPAELFDVYDQNIVGINSSNINNICVPITAHECKLDNELISKVNSYKLVAWYPKVKTNNVICIAFLDEIVNHYENKPKRLNA